MKKSNTTIYPPKSSKHFAERAPQGPDKTPPDELRLISKAEVLRRIGVSYPTIWKWMRDENFPRSRNLGGKSAWIESEVTAWIRNCPVVKLKGEIGAPAKPGFALNPHTRQKAEA
jgi:predicted DNA-binding transcriptional regulator AlpA